MFKAQQEKAPEKCSTNEKSFSEVMEKGKREIKEFLDELSQEKEEKSYKESRNEKLEKLKIDDLRVGENSFKKFLNDNMGDVKKFFKIKRYDKRPMHMMHPILNDTMCGLMSKYDLEQFEGACLMGLFKMIKILVLN